MVAEKKNRGYAMTIMFLNFGMEKENLNQGWNPKLASLEWFIKF